eukprot:m.36959 g.36959  ORF g.36959 m.36959 type:complete len:235 (-) comp44885_c0_seq1:109-813(-)
MLSLASKAFYFCLTVSFLFYVIALAVPEWSYGKLTSPTQRDIGFNIGPFKACASSDTAQFFASRGNDCRYGQCTLMDTFTLDSDVLNHSCCRVSKAVMAFTFIAIFLSAFVFYATVVLKLMGRPEWKGPTTPLLLLITSCGVLDLIIWGAWQGAMNDDASRDTGTQTVGSFKTGASFALVIVAVILNLFSILFQRFRTENKMRKTQPSLTAVAGHAATSDTELSEGTSGSETTA